MTEREEGRGKRAKGVRILFGRFVRDEQGVVAVIVALSMAALLGFTALALDGGYLYIQRTQLQKAADAAALAGAYALWPSGSGMQNDAGAQASSNGVSPCSNWGSLPCNGDATTTWLQNGPDQIFGDDVKPDAWQVTIQRKVPLTFAPVLGFSAGTVTVTAVAINSPCSVCKALPYAVWGGNNMNDPYIPPTDPNAQVTDPNTPCCPNSNLWIPSVQYVSPCTWQPTNSLATYDWYQCLDTSTVIGSTVDYRDNQWADAVVFPAPNNCGGNNQPPCNPNWNVNSRADFKGFLHNANDWMRTGTFVLAGTGNADETSDLNQLCQIISDAQSNGTSRIALMPVVDYAAMTCGSCNGQGNVQLYIKYFIGVYLQPVSDCSGGKATGISYYANATGPVVTSFGEPDGPKESPVHVLKLWQ